MQDQTKFTNYMVVLTDEDRQITHLFQFSERRKKKKWKCLDATYRFSYIKFILVHYHHKRIISLSLSLPNIYILDVIALKTLSYGKSIYEIVMRDYALPLHKLHKDNFSYNFLQ